MALRYTHDAFGARVQKGDTVITIASDPDFPFAVFLPARVLKVRTGEAWLLPHGIYDNEPFWCRSDAFIYKCNHIQLPQPTIGRHCIPCGGTTEWERCAVCLTFYCPEHKHRCRG